MGYLPYVSVRAARVVDAVKSLLPTLREQLPASVSLDTRFDRSVSIRDSVHDVKFTLMLTVVLVVSGASQVR